MKIKYVIYAILLLVIGGFIVYRVSSGKDGPGNNADTAGNRSTSLTVSAVVVKARSFSDVLNVSGSIEAGEQVEVRGEVSGVVQEIFFDEGSRVKKGQVLLSIDDSELQAQLAQAKTREQLAAETERRAGLLLEKEAISQEEYDIASADHRSTQAQTQLIEAQIAKTKVRAHFDGTIGLRHISAGEYLIPTTVVANLVNLNPIKILFSVPEKHSSKVRINTPINFQVSGSDKTYSGTVYAIEPGVNVNTRTLQIKARADNTKRELLPGAFAKVELPLSTIDQAILIPTESVVPVLNGKQAFVVKEGKAQAVDITTESRTNREVLISSGISEGDTVLTTGLMAVKDGTPVQVKLIDN